MINDEYRAEIGGYVILLSTESWSSAEKVLRDSHGDDLAAARSISIHRYVARFGAASQLLWVHASSRGVAA